MKPETYTKRQAIHHVCLPNFLGDGDKVIEIVYGVEKNTFCSGPRLNKKSVVPAR
jgi:hypothetical protein